MEEDRETETSVRNTKLSVRSVIINNLVNGVLEEKCFKIKKHRNVFKSFLALEKSVLKVIFDGVGLDTLTWKDAEGSICTA